MAKASRGGGADGGLLGGRYRVECEVSVRGGPWQAYWVNVDGSSRVPSAHGAAWVVKDSASVGTGLGPDSVRVRGTRVLPWSDE